MADSNDILLKEYETCQQDNNSIASQYWIIAGIFVAINTALLGGVVYIISNRIPLAEWLVLALGLGIIAIIVFLWCYFDRVNFIISSNYYRMRKIENELRIEKNWLVHGLDLKYDPKRHGDWGELPDERKASINEFSASYPSQRWHQWFWRSSAGYVPPTGIRSMKGIFSVLIILWVAFIVMAFVFCNC